EDDVDSLTTTTEAPHFVFPLEMTTQSAILEKGKGDAKVANRTKMIVANEISNLPRFDPKNSARSKSPSKIPISTSVGLSPTPEFRSEERRVGKEGRYGWWRCQ